MTGSLRPAPRPALALFLSLAALAGVSGCGGGSGTEVVTLRLDTDAPCYGMVAQVATDAGDKVSCAAVPSLGDDGCTTNVEASVGGLELRAFGCFVADDQPLFTCTVPSSAARDLREHTQVRCGCGCAADCPDSPALAVCDEDGASCVGPAAARGATRADRPQPTTTAVGSVAVESTVCGTCCDAGGDTSVRLAGGQGLRELRFDLDVGGEQGVLCSIDSCEFAPSIQGPRNYEHLGENRVRVCIADAEGLDAGRLLVTCSIWTGGNLGVIDEISALDANLETPSPAPVLQTE